MSEKDPINLKQDRRQWFKSSATVLGAAVLPISGAATEWQQASTPDAAAGAKPPAPEAKEGARFFTPAQYKLVEELSETIIPADSHSAGAKAAKVADYIEQRVSESTDDQQKALWREGLRLIESMCQHYNAKSFIAASPEERIAVLQVLSDNERMTELVEVRFFHELKSMTVRGYYTTKIGLHDELEYKGNRILQEFVGCADPTPPTT